MDIVEAGGLLEQVQIHFVRINQDKNLTDADKKQLKEFYLDNFIAPRARKLLQKCFPEDFPAYPVVGTAPFKADANKFSTHTSEGAIIWRLIS